MKRILKSINLQTVVAAVAILFSMFFTTNSLSAQTYDPGSGLMILDITSPGSGTYAVPTGVANITVEAIGGGGGGGSVSNTTGARGGGGGGAYAKSTVTGASGLTYSYTVGDGGTSNTNNNTVTNGGDSRFYRNTTDYVKAQGGRSVARNSTTGGNGGSATGTNSIGNVARYAGGAGGAGVTTGNPANTRGGGGGGGAAGTSGAGGAGNRATAGIGASEFGGNGGTGSNSHGPGAVGLEFGGGGAGARTTSNATVTGGKGASGAMRISYVPAYRGEYTNVDLGSAMWEINETRAIAVTIKNTGQEVWPNSSPKVEIVAWWGSNPSAQFKVDADNLSSNEERLYTISVTAPSVESEDYLFIDVVGDGVLWLSQENIVQGIAGSERYMSNNIYIVSSANRIYSYKTGNWDDPKTWTFDPSGTQYINPDNQTPSSSEDSVNDEVFILSGRTVTMTENSKLNKEITIVGTLDVAATTGHSFNKISGTGRIRLAGDNFPSGDATHFVSAGQGEGTVEYYGSARALTTNRTYYNMNVNMSSGQTLTFKADYTIGGNLNINSGTFAINDNSTFARNIDVYGNVTVASGASISVGTGNARHQLNLYGNFTNNGTAKFTNLTAPNYTTDATNGIVDVNFLNGSKDQSIFCSGVTNFYRIGIDKGTDQTFILNIDATSSANFNLLGRANENHNTSAVQLTANNNALGLIRGTVRIGNSINIPVLSTADYYAVSENAQLWVDGGTVQKNEGNSIVIAGRVKVTSGTLEAKVSNGFGLRANGIIDVQGGVVNVNQIKTATYGGTNNFGGYIQTGGNVNVLGNHANTNNSFYVFNLPSPSSVFNMGGGTLTVNTADSNSSKGAIFINSASENIKVTGGTVIAEIKNANDFKITSTAPFWNLIFKNSTTAQRNFTLVGADNFGGYTVAAQPLQVLKDFRLWGKDSGGSSYPVVNFNPGSNDVYVGGSFYVENGALYSANQNTTHFIKTVATKAVEEIKVGDATNSLEIGSLVIDRSKGYEVKLTSASSRDYGTVVLDVKGDATVLSGILNQNLFTIRTWRSVVNNDRMGTWVPGTTPSGAQIQLVDDGNLTITAGKDAVFGNVQINSTSTLTFTSDVYVERLQLVQGLIYLKSYNLKVDNLWSIDEEIFEDSESNSYLKVANRGASGGSMIYTDGKASDAGLSLRVEANSLADDNQNNRLNNAGPTTYPLGFTDGTNLYFRPAQMMVRDYSSPGYVTIRPVMGALPTTDQSGGAVLQHYWRVSHSNFSSLPTVSFRFYYRNRTGTNVDLVTAGNDGSFVPGKVLDETPYTRGYENANDINKSTNTRIVTINGAGTNGEFTHNSNGITLENANYTAGVHGRFTGSVIIYYSIDNNNVDGNKGTAWNRAASWTRSDILNSSYKPHDSRQPQSGIVPGAGDVVVIGWIPWDDRGRDASLRGQPHCIWLTDEREVAEVVFTPMTDEAGNPVERVYRSNFQFRPTLAINGNGDVNGYDNDNRADNGILKAKLVKGEGMFWNRQSAPDYDLMDIGDFARQDSSYVIYENFTAGRTINNTPPLFPNLYIANDNWGNNTHRFIFTRDIETTGNVELLGGVNLVLPTSGGGDIVVGRDLIFFDNNTNGNGQLLFGNTGVKRKVEVRGDLIMKSYNSRILVDNPNGNSTLEHELKIYGDITIGLPTRSSRGLLLWTANNRAKITLYLEGDKSMEYTRNSGIAPTFYRIVVNKGNSINTTATFNNTYTLRGSTSGSGVAKALELQNGLFIHNTTSNLTLTSGNDHFNIPATAGLEMRRGTAKASGTSGIALDGLLRLNGGNVDMSGGDNPIEYSASGSATLDISNGTLTVGGQIRRSKTSDVGVLKYKQSGGSVIAGNNIAGVDNRGVFEILNAGSSFNMSGGSLHIVREQTTPSISAFYFNPDTYSIGTNASINIGHSSTPYNQTIGVYAGKPLSSLVINNSSGQLTAKLEVVPATITNLTINSGAILDANGIDLNIKGNFDAFGTYTANGNTTYFNGTGTQNIDGGGSNIDFYNLEKLNSNNLVLKNNGSTPITVNNKLLLRAGTLTDNGNNITVKGDVLNDATHVAGSGNGIILNGDETQTLQGNGTFGKLTINNFNGVTIPIGNVLSVSTALRLQSGVLNIGGNLFNIGQDAIIEAVNPFSASNMIETNLSFEDNGLRKIFPSGAREFTFPVGLKNKYTPVTFDITSNNVAGGSITVLPANEIHPSIIEDEESEIQIVDKDNALQYYWTLKADGLSNFSAKVQMKYNEDDVRVTSPYTVADYHPAYLLADGVGEWRKFPQSDFNEISKTINFSFSNVNSTQISGDYTAGAGDASLDGAIPNEVPKYETLKTGLWTESTVWDPNVNGGPSGAIAKINNGHTVTLPDDHYVSAYMTEIYGTINQGSTAGHRFGIVNGTGTISLEFGQIPAAVYDNFFSAGGGTIEFTGTNEYEFLGNVSLVNHLKLSGSGLRILPNNNLTLNGNLTINGSSSLGLVNGFDKKLSIKGNLSRISGTFSAGSGANATVSLNGTLHQTITGNFNGNNAFNNLEINNSNGITIVDNVEVNENLNLANGVIDIDSNGSLRIMYNGKIVPSTGTSTSYVNGELTKEMMTGGSFTFPIGNGGSYEPIGLQSVSGPSGKHNWKATYFNEDATVKGYNTESFDNTIIADVSQTGYWKIEAPTGGSSKISLVLNGTSAVANGAANLTDLRVVGWNDDIDKWEIVGTAVTATGTASSGTVTTTTSVNYGSYSYFTLASVAPVELGTASITSGAAVEICSGANTTITIAFMGDAPFVLTYNEGGVNKVINGIATKTYQLIVSPNVTTTYTLESVTSNGVPGVITGNGTATVTVNPNPVVVISRTGSGSVCEGNIIAFTATDELSNYQFRADGAIVQNGAGRSYTDNSPLPGTRSYDVIGTNSYNCSATSNAITVDVNPLPVAAGAISGPASVCRGDNPQFSITEIANATSYVWSATNGATISGSGRSVTITFPTAGTSTITVYGKNNCGNGASSTFTVAVNTVSTPGNAGAITGTPGICKGGEGYTFSVGSVTNATSYIWEYSGTGATINGTGNSITIDFASNATNGNLTVKGTNGCKDGGVSTNYAIVANNTPTASISPATLSVCSGSDLEINGSATGGTSPYNSHAWSVDNPDLLSSTTVQNPTFNSPEGGSYELVYTVTDSKGCEGTATKTVSVATAPVADAGEDALGLCTGTNQIAMTGATATGSYSGTPVWSGAGGVWTQSPTDAALASFTPLTPSGSTTAYLTLTGANGCATVVDSKEISWNKAPERPTFDVAVSEVCQAEEDVVFSVIEDGLATSYNWSYNGSGADIIGDGKSVSIDFSKNATTGALSVTANNNCGTSLQRQMEIAINPVFDINLTSDAIDEVCADNTITFTATPVGGSWDSYELILNDVSSQQSQNGNSFTASRLANNDKVYVVGTTDKGCENASNEIMVAVSTTPGVWTGSVSSDIDEAYNWCNGQAPSVNDVIDVVVKEGKNTFAITGDRKFGTLTVNNKATAVLKPNATLDINNVLKINEGGKFILENNYKANGLSSLKTLGDVIGKVDVQLTLPTNEWYYLASPMSEPKTSQFGVGNVDGTYAYTYSKSKAWVLKSDDEPIENGEGMSVYYLDGSNSEIMLDYSGQLNTGEVKTEYTSKNFYLFANPFPVSINWQDDDDTWRNRIAGTIWYRTRVGSEMGFVTYNRYGIPGTRVALYPEKKYEDYTEAELGLIPPYQSVWVYTRTATAADPAFIKVTDAQKVHRAPESSGATLKSSSSGKKSDIIRIVAKNDRSRDGAVIYFSEGSTDALDQGDSEKYFNSSTAIPEVYTRIGKEAIAINGLAPFEGSYVVPLSVRNRVEGEVELRFDLSLYRSDDVIVLQDSHLDEKINLRSQNTYKYEPTSLGDNHARFSILINPEDYDGGDEVLTNIEDAVYSGISIQQIEDKALITVSQELLNANNGNIFIYDIEGRRVADYVSTSEKQYIDLPDAKGVYIITVIVGDKQKREKIIVK